MAVYTMIRGAMIRGELLKAGALLMLVKNLVSRINEKVVCSNSIVVVGGGQRQCRSIGAR